MKPTLLILAAGIGSRYGGLKQIDGIGPHGEAIIDYSVYDALRAGFGKIVFVIRHDIETDFREIVGRRVESKIAVEYAYQELPAGFTAPLNRQKPWGTGHAVLVAKEVIQEPFAVINADDFYGTTSFKLLSDYFGNLPSTALATDYALVGFVLRHTLSKFGTVSRGICYCDEQNFIRDIVEIVGIEAQADQAKYIDETWQTRWLTGNEVVSMNTWGFTPLIFEQLDQLFSQFLQARGHDLKAEFYLPMAVNALIASGQARVKMLPSQDAWFGMTYQEDKPHVRAGIQTLVAQGIYPNNLLGN